MWNSPIQGRTQCEFKTELFGEIGETSLSSQILKNQLVLRSRIQTEMAKSKSKTIEILTLHQPRLELEKLEAAECLNRLRDLSRTGFKEGDVVVRTFRC